MGTRIRRPTSNFKPCPEGLHPAVCVDVWDIWTGPKHERWGGGLQDNTRLVFQIDQTYTNDDGNVRTYEASQMYTASVHEKSKLRQHLESWRGKKFTEDDINVFIDGPGLESLVGINCQIQVIHNIKDNGDTYANIITIVPRHKSSPMLEPSPDFVRKKDREKKPDSVPENEQEVGDQFTATDDDVPF